MAGNKSIKLSKYFEIKKPIYAALKIIPHSSTRNYNSDSIAKMVANMYRSITKSIHRVERKYVVETAVKCSYIVDISLLDVCFYFLVPIQYKKLAYERITSTWPQATVEDAQIPKIQGDNVTTYQLKYKNLDAFSLACDKRTNTALENNLNVLDIMEQDDRVMICYNFIPCSQYNWRATCKNAHKEYLSNNPISKSVTSGSIAIYLINGFLSIVESILNGLGSNIKEGSALDQARALLDLRRKEISDLSMKKYNSTVLETQIAVISTSSNKDRSVNNAISVCQGYRTLDADNELIYSKAKTPDLLETKYKQIEPIKASVDECREFIQIPGRELLESHNINHTRVLESKVPEELQHGYIKIGKSTYKGNTVQTYFSQDKEIANLPVIFLGPMGAGKTFQNKEYAKDVTTAGEGLIAIDYIKNCDLANKIEKITPKERLIVLDLSKEECLQAFAYNEYKLQGTTPFERVESANLHQQQVTALIDAVYVGEPLSGQMRKFFTSAADVVLINDNMSLKDIIRVLENHEIRHKFIDKIPVEYMPYLEDQVEQLKQLDDKDKEGNIVGTKYSKIEHILDRVNSLREDIRMRFMFNKPATDNLDFAKAMNQGKIILIKMPANKFRSEHVRNVLVTFFISKIWLACNIRGSEQERPLRYHLLLDEIFQAPTAYKPLSNILRECRKFQLRLVFTAHQLEDLKELNSGLKSAGASYILMQKTDKANFKYLEQEFSQKGFTVDDLLNLKRYHALNLICYSDGYTAYESDLEVK
nr:MAG TPA: AAA-like domain protein [Caudoviricetes sp.]